MFCNLKVIYRSSKVTFKTQTMETSLIEQLDKSRYDFMKWSTIGWTIWFGTYILTDFISAPEVPGFISWIRLLGWFILIVSTIRFVKLKRELNWDNKMKEALDDELHLHNRIKSFQIGYFVVIGLTLLFFVLSLYTAIPAVIVTKLTLYFGVLAVLISKLIFNRA